MQYFVGRMLRFLLAKLCVVYCVVKIKRNVSCVYNSERAWKLEYMHLYVEYCLRTQNEAYHRAILWCYNRDELCYAGVDCLFSYDININRDIDTTVSNHQLPWLFWNWPRWWWSMPLVPWQPVLLPIQHPYAATRTPKRTMYIIFMWRLEWNYRLSLWYYLILPLSDSDL